MPTFDTPNSTQTWTVPSGASTIVFELEGAGGGASSYPRQPGGYATGEYAIAGGSTITVYIGEGGQDGGEQNGAAGLSPLADGSSGEQATFDPKNGAGGGGATAIEAPDGTLIAAADAAGGSGGDGSSNKFPRAGGGGGRGGSGGEGTGDAQGTGFGGDGGRGSDSFTGSSSPGEAGGAEVAGGVTNATTTTGGGVTGDGIVTLAVPLAWDGSSVAVTPTEDQLAVTWADDPSVDSYVIEHRVQGASTWTAATVSAPAADYTITGLLEGQAYEVRVTAQTAIESTTSPIRTATTVLPAPIDLQATGVRPTEIDLSWTAQHSRGQTRVECKPTDASQWGDAVAGGAETTVDHTIEQATLTGLRHAERYDIRAVAITPDASAIDYSPDVATGETLTVAAGTTETVTKPFENSGTVEVEGVLEPADAQ